MPTLYLMVGLPCSGKTTLAKEMEQQLNALRLSPDEWIAPLYGPNLTEAELDRTRDPIEAVQWRVAARALSLGLDVILDFGFWSRQERDDYRERAATLGARSEIRFLDVPLPELERRLAARNANLPDNAFIVTHANLHLWAGWFEPPTPDELVAREVGPT
jgi:predicted kinase